MADIQSDGQQLLELALFAGAGGGILGGKLLGWRTVAAVEINAYAASVLVARQNDGCLEPFPVWDDIRTFRSDNEDCAGMFDMLRAVRHRLVVSGGFPCTNISVVGDGTGLDGDESRLWSEQARVIREIRPRFAFVENSPALTSRGLDRVLGDLAEMGRNARWGVLAASDAIWLGGTPSVYHDRDRIWIVTEDANPELPWISQRRGTEIAGQGVQITGGIHGHVAPSCQLETSQGTEITHPMQKRLEGIFEAWSASRADNGPSDGNYPSWWKTEPELGRVADGVADRVDRTEAIGNGQVPLVAAAAWRILTTP